MFCKFCGEELEPKQKECPACGKPASNDGWKIAVIVLVALILSAVLVVAVLFGTGVLGKKDKDDKGDKGGNTSLIESDRTPVVSGFTDDNTAAEKSQGVVATCGDMELTNSALQFFYWSEVYNFMNENYYYLSYYGLDLSAPLGDQAYIGDTTMTWEEYFLDRALESWKSYAALCQQAEENGFALSEEDAAYLEGLEAELLTEATASGYATVEEMLLDQAGPGATAEGLIAYRTTMYVAMQYFASIYADMEPTDAEVTAYWDENASEFEATGVTKDSGRYGDVRHILISPEGGTYDATTNTTTYSEEEWAACLAAAQEVYDLWKKGEATEESFVAMVADYTDDTASITTGGLYEDIGPDSNYVPEFKAWASDASRKIGDTALVKTDYGYHFMYYVGGEDIWFVSAKDALLNDRVMEFMEEGLSKVTMDTDYEQIVLGSVKLA